MSQLQTAPLVGRLSGALQESTTRVVLAGTAAAWIALGILEWGGSGERGLGATHAHHAPTDPAGAADVLHPAGVAWVGTWLLMVVAMMWPLTLTTLGAITRSSFRGWRIQLGLACLATVTALWLVAGLAGALSARLLSVEAGSLWWQLSFVGLALVLLRSARRSRVLEKCLRLPAVAPGGRRGVLTAARAGALTWRRCAILCGPVMLAMTVGHSLVLMTCASVAVWWEAWHPRAWRDPVPVVLLAAAGAWLVVSAMVDGTLGHG